MSMKNLINGKVARSNSSCFLHAYGCIVYRSSIGRVAQISGGFQIRDAVTAFSLIQEGANCC